MTFRKDFTLAISVVSIGLLSACSETRYAAHVVKQIPFPGESDNVGHFKVGNAYKIQGKRYYPSETYNHTEVGTASWYGPNFHGKQTANGEIFDKHELTAAHRTLQLPSIIRVTNLTNGRSAILRVNDRGPFAHDRVLDVSERAATVLGFKNKGTTKVRIEVLADASKEVASRAKQGLSTRGFEVALNNGQMPTSTRTHLASTRTIPAPMAKPEPITQVALTQNTMGEQPVVPLHKPMAVQSEPLTSINRTTTMTNSINGSNVANLNNGRIYVQAGSFSQEQNALSFSDRLSSYGQSKVYLTRVNNQPFFRVRLGPYNDRGQAQEILTALNQSGNRNAVIVVD